MPEDIGISDSSDLRGDEFRIECPRQPSDLECRARRPKRGHHSSSGMRVSCAASRWIGVGHLQDGRASASHRRSCSRTANWPSGSQRRASSAVIGSSIVDAGGGPCRRHRRVDRSEAAGRSPERDPTTADRVSERAVSPWPRADVRARVQARLRIREYAPSSEVPADAIRCSAPTVDDEIDAPSARMPACVERRTAADDGPVDARRRPRPKHPMDRYRAARQSRRLRHHDAGEPAAGRGRPPARSCSSMSATSSSERRRRAAQPSARAAFEASPHSSSTSVGRKYCSSTRT